MNNKAVWTTQRDDLGFKVGDIGYLIHVSPEKGADYYVLRDEPAVTNMSYEPRPIGWCGNTNGTSITGYGEAEVVRVTSGGERLQVRKIEVA